ncbi:Cullin [Mycotypha africana]|uniref:Cullin n=1 Tax=Mycotypha africana TaxID=64632 RepID=UPI002301A84A|nr:Cullin [Mycotypha africana]KAI8992081.1 Cullin [Mycotypha africana]
MSLKKGRIRPVKRMPTHTQEYDEGFEILSNAMMVIFKKQARELSYELLYRTAYNLTIRQFGERLYHDVEKVIATYLETIAEQQVVPAFTNTASADEFIASNATADEGALFLNTIKKVWDDYTAAIDLILQVLYYLNERLPKYNLPGIYDMGLNLFRDRIIHSNKYPIQQNLISAMLRQIQLERTGDVIDRSALQSAVDMLVKLADPSTQTTVYATDFESKYLETSTSFYQIESQTLISECDAPEFMRRVEKRLDEEYERTVHCLSMSTEPKIRNIVETQLIAKNLKTLMEMTNSGLKSMLDADKYTDLLRMYNLFARVPAGLNEMRTFMSQYILDLGSQINQNTTTDLKEHRQQEKGSNAAINWVLQVLSLQEKFDKLLEQAANNDKSFQTIFNEAFEHFINENQKSAEFISLFIDENLKKGLKGKSEDEVDDILDKTITLFRYLQDKDVFERYYKQHLAKRLLFNRSVSDDAERGMLSKLKRECGYQFTNKLEGMFNDMKLSAEMNSQFKDYLEKRSTTDADKLFDTSVTVLTSTFWPLNLSASPKCTLPANLLQACQSFERFYFDRHSGRRLTWQPQMGSADLRAQFSKSKHLLNVSTYAMIVLLLFNENDSLTFDEILHNTQIPEQDLKRTLQSLSAGKYKLLTRKSTASEEERESKKSNASNYTFTFNAGFTSNMARIKIQAFVSKVESDNERKQTQDKVDEERKHQIEACIVRIMKDRKTMEHNLLIAEATKQLSSRFIPSPVMIKKRIEALIDREYLERDAEDRRSYHYLA